MNIILPLCKKASPKQAWMNLHIYLYQQIRTNTLPTGMVQYVSILFDLLLSDTDFQVLWGKVCSGTQTKNYFYQSLHLNKTCKYRLLLPFHPINTFKSVPILIPIIVTYTKHIWISMENFRKIRIIIRAYNFLLSKTF
jgi:hypothetical protein